MIFELCSLRSSSILKINEVAWLHPHNVVASAYLSYHAVNLNGAHHTGHPVLLLMELEELTIS